MGEVFLAKAGAKGFERYFAIKRILTKHEGADDFEKMLINEARISIGLVHPNIAQVFEFGHLEGHFFLAMEYVDGLSVSKVLNAGLKSNQPVPTPDAIFIAMQVCRALDYAHDKVDTMSNPLGIIHRDISPQNILIDTSGSVKLIDFGIAKAAGAAAEQQTEAGFIKGKLGYMSPEQARGTSLDRRTDIFSLGIVLYEMLAMRRCFTGANPMEQLRLVQLAEVPPLETLGTGAPMPPSLKAALFKALAADREARFARAGELEQALAHALSDVDKGYTSQGLARLVRQLDFERDVRSDRFKKYADIHTEQVLPTRVPGDGGGPLPGVKADFDAQVPTVGLDPMSESARLRAEAGSGSLRQDLQSVEIPIPARRPWLRDLILALAILPGVGAGLYLAFGRHEPAPPITPPVTTAPAAALQPAAPVPSPPATPAPAATTVAAPTDAGAPPPMSKAAAKGAKGRKKAARGAEAAAPGAAPAAAEEVTGCVAVVVEPWADVLLDGKKLGTTPIKCLALKPGSYQLTLSNPATGAAKQVRVKVEAKKTVKVFEQL
ncbi:MAG: serine/threonine protein kinase [Deltaproteobacteria bacterium]|nr:serine/threonine protein kinase [Deltaproteobacteria bacterium]